MEIKKLAQQKYEMLLKREREQLSLTKLNQVRKQEEMRKLHERIAIERQYKTDLDHRLEKMEKIEIERQILAKKEEEQKILRDFQRQQELELRQKES